MKSFLVSLLILLGLDCARANSIPSTYLPSSGWNGEVGIPGGIPGGYTGSPVAYIPVGYATKYCDVTVSIPGYSGALADPTGVADSSPAINSAVGSCPASEYVYIPAGTYRLNSTISRTGIYNFDSVQHPFSIEIKGAGPKLTHLQFFGGGGNIIQLLAWGEGSSSGNGIASGDTRGSTSIVFSGTFPSFISSTPMSMEVIRANANAINPCITGGVDPSYESNSCSQIVEISSFNSSTKTVNFTPALNEAYSGDSISIGLSQPYQCGIQDLSLENMSDNGGDNILMTYPQECWISDVESIRASGYHFHLEQAVRCQEEANFVHDGWEAGGNRDYGSEFFQWGSNNLVQNNIYLRCRHAMPLEYGGQGNVYYANYSDLPINSDQAIGFTVSGATNATPIVCTTSAATNLTTGLSVQIGQSPFTPVGGNTAANVVFSNIKVLSSTTFALYDQNNNPIAGNGAFTSSGQGWCYGLPYEMLTDYLMGDSINHGGEPRWNLREANVCATVKFDDVLGGSYSNTVFRNQFTRTSVPACTVANYGSDIQTWTYNTVMADNVYTLPPNGYSGALRRWGTNQDNTDTLGSVTGASNATPIVITTAGNVPNHDYYYVAISGVLGNTAANGTFVARAINSTTYSLYQLNGGNTALVAVAGNGAYTTGGTVVDGIDPLSQASALVDGDYDLNTGTNTWLTSDHSYPSSELYSSKPSWWDSGNWPGIGPDQSPAAGGNPAQRRALEMMAGASSHGLATQTPNPTSN
jgi:hypothetical protein